MDAERPLDRPLLVRLAANTFVLIVGSIGASLISFLTFVAVTRGLGPEAFGNLTAATVFVFIPVVLADVGLFTAVLREISAAPERTESVTRASLPLRGLIAIAIALALVVSALVIPFNDQTRIAIAVGSIGAFFTFMELTLQPVLQAQLKMQWAVLATLAGRSTSLALTLAVLAAGLGFNGVVFAIAAGPAVTFLVEAIIVGRLVSLVPAIDLPYWRTLVRGSLALGLAIALAQVYFRVDVLLVAAFRPAAEVGLYGAAYKFVEMAAIVATAIGLSVFPSLARFVETGDTRLSPLLQKTFDIALTAAVPLTILMLVFPSELISFSAGSEFDEAASVLRLLAPYPLFMFLTAVLVRFLIARRQDRRLLVISIVVLGANIMLNVILLPIYGFEVAAVVCVCTEAASLAMTAWLLHRIGGPFPSVRYLPVIAGAAALMLVVAVAAPAPPVAAAAFALTVYGIALVCAPGTVRDAFRRILVEVRPPPLRNE